MKAMRAAKRILGPRRTFLARREDGFTMIETVMAMMLFAFIAVGLVGLLQSSISANTLSRQKTVAQQVGQEHVEWIRKLNYDQVGVVNGNPPGVVPATKPISVRAVEATITTQIRWVNDPTRTGYVTGANYKKVTVTVTANRTGRVLASTVTFVAPPSGGPYGGLNKAILNVRAMDLQASEPIGDAAVALSTGPSAPLNDLTDSTTGLVTFAALTPNPTSGSQAYYDVAVTKSGYETYVDYISPAAPAHVQLAPSQTLDTTILLYRPVTMTVALQDAFGNPYAGTATVKVTSERSATTQTYTATSGSTPPISTFAGRPMAPGNFTVRAFTTGAGPLCADPVTQLAWDGYPSTLASTITLGLQTCPSGTLVVNVTQSGAPAANATVQVSGGPNDISAITGTTNAAGTVTFTNLPSGTDAYAITATDVAGIVSGSTTATISTGQTTTKTINLADPPFGSIQAMVRWLGAAVNSATVRVQGGPYAIDRTLTTGGSGNVTFTNVPAGSGYTVTATKNGQSRTVTGVTVTAGSTTSVTLNMPAGTINVTATWAGLPAGNVGGTPSVTITGGPNGGTYSATITNAGGTVSVAVPATTSAYPYTVTVTKNQGSGTASVTTLADAGTAAANVALTPVKTLTLTIQSGGSNIPNSPVTVSLTDGPNGDPNVVPAYQFVGNTNASSQVVLTVPVQSSGSYRVKVLKTGCPAGSNKARSTTVLADATTTTATIDMNSSSCPTLP